MPFVKYLLGTIISAYRDFEERAALVSEKLSSLEMVRRAAATMIGKITKTDIMEMTPSLSSATVERSIRKLCENGELDKYGQGKSTYYLRKQ